MKRILIIQPASDMAGVSQYILALLKGLPQGFDVIFGSSERGPVFEEVEKLGYKTTVLPLNYSLGRLLRSGKELSSFIKEEKIELVYAHNLRAGLLAFVARSFGRFKLAYCAHGWKFVQVKLSKPLFFLLDLFICRSSCSVIVLSNKEREQGGKWLFRGRKTDAIIPMHVDMPDRIGQAEDGLIGMVGRIAYQKDPEGFCKIAKRILEDEPDSRFVWIGGGDKEELKRSAAKVGIEGRLEIKGYMSREETLKEVARFSVFLFTSRFEGLPIVVLEAMSLGVPVVGSNVGSVSDIIKNGETGFLYEPGDHETAAGLVEDCLRMGKEDRSIMSEEERKLIGKDFSPQKDVARKHLKAWSDL